MCFGGKKEAEAILGGRCNCRLNKSHQEGDSPRPTIGYGFQNKDLANQDQEWAKQVRMGLALIFLMKREDPRTGQSGEKHGFGSSLPDSENHFQT